MCYDLAYLTKKELNYAKRFGARQDIEELEERLRTFHVNGYDHPDVPVITTNDPQVIDLYQWGLIPGWAKDLEYGINLQNSTLNARSETLFTRSAFKDAAHQGNRCLILVDGFFEHHHKDGKTFPYFIHRKDSQPFAIAGLWSHWKGNGFLKKTFTVITTKGNKLLSRIHNNPKLEGPRMPVIIPKPLEKEWLQPGRTREEITNRLQPLENDILTSYTVPRLRGKQAVGNKPEALKEYKYDVLNSKQGSLF